VTSALFGPDGTEPPEPDEVLPDALAMTLTPLPDADAVLRVARAAAGAREESLATPPAGLPAQRPRSAGDRSPARDRPPAAPPPGRRASAPPPAASSQVAEPLGVRQRPPAPPGYPPAPHVARRAQVPPGYLPPVAPPPQFRWPEPDLPRTAAPRPVARQPGSPQPAQRPAQPAQPPAQREGRSRRRGKDATATPLIEGNRSSRSGSRIGCIVFLIFVVAAFWDSVQALVNALLDLVR
jgi:hypothetical protein